MVEWVELSPDDPMLQPVHGPPCPGLNTHPWYLTVEEGRVSLNSGCMDCEDAVMGPVGGEDVGMNVRIQGTLTSHLEVFGYETPEYDHWWEFVPSAIMPEVDG